MKNQRLSDLEEEIRELCMFLYSQSSEESSSIMSADEVESLCATEMLSHIFESFKELLSVRREYAILKEYSYHDTSETFQEPLQRLEQESRRHFKTQLQLKLFMDNLEARLEHSGKRSKTKKQEYTNTIEELETENRQLKKILIKIDECQHLEKSKVLRHNLKKKKEDLSNLTKEFNTLKSMNRQLKRRGGIQNSEMYKLKYEEASQECSQIRKIILERNAYESKIRIKSRSISPFVDMKNKNISSKTYLKKTQSTCRLRNKLI